MKFEGKYQGTKYCSIITENDDKILCPEKKLKGWIENIKIKGTEKFLFIYRLNEYGEMLLEKIFPIWKNSFVEKSLKVSESEKKKISLNINEEKIRKIFREEFKKILVLLSSNYES